jgi:Na+/H+-dicarboxylate symporter
MVKTKGISQATQIMIAMVAGSIVGIVLGPPAQGIKFIGDMWLNLLKMVMVPMVLFVVVKAISTMDNPKTLGRIGLKVIIFYACTTSFATIVGILMGLIFQPGIGFHFEKATKVFETPKVLTFQSYLSSLFSPNMFASFYNADMMQVLVISIFVGLSVILLKNNARIPLKEWFANMADLSFSFVELVMKLAPVGVFCIMAAALSASGLGTFISMGKLLATFYGTCLIQVVLVYLVFLWLTTRIGPLTFLRKSAKVWLTAISTCSSAAVIPVNLKTSDEEFQVSDKISSFSIPFGAQFNQDGGAILSALVILFSAQAIGVQFGPMELVRMVLVCTLVSAGTGAIPGGGIVRLMVSSAAFGMPLEIVTLIAGFYRFFDMGTTSMSVIGDLSGTVIIDRWEKRKDVAPATNPARS